MQIGDILFIKKGEVVPADVLLLEMSSSYGILDETNVKGIFSFRKIFASPLTYGMNF